MSVKNATYPERNASVATIRYAAITLAFASEFAHLWFLPEELIMRPFVGGFIFLAAVLQGLFAVSLLFGASRRMVRFGIQLNTATVLGWIVTRFWVLPVEPLGLAVTVVEVALIVLLFRLRRDLKAERERRVR